MNSSFNLSILKAHLVSSGIHGHVCLADNGFAGLPCFGEKSGKFNFIQGQEIVRQFLESVAKFESMVKSRVF